ncbi:MAG: thiamine phosphate synthase [Balneolaceae bacterium]|nr:thiamine phosphate synthase [Balneolaceae bacterium]
MTKPTFRYYLITDRKKCVPRVLPDLVEEACRSGIRAVQLREKDLNGRSLYLLAKELRTITARWNTKLFINDRVDIALAVEADGVHCRETSIPPAKIKKMNTSLRLGASVHSLESAEEAQKRGADFLLFGPVFHTISKAKYGDPQGIENLKRIVESVKISVYAVGGITPERAQSCLEAGAFGVAGISSIMEADSVADKVGEWKDLIGAL